MSWPNGCGSKTVPLPATVRLGPTVAAKQCPYRQQFGLTVAAKQCPYRQRSVSAQLEQKNGALTGSGRSWPDWGSKKAINNRSSGNYGRELPLVKKSLASEETSKTSVSDILCAFLPRFILIMRFLLLFVCVCVFRWWWWWWCSCCFSTSSFSFPSLILSSKYSPF